LAGTLDPFDQLLAVEGVSDFVFLDDGRTDIFDRLVAGESARTRWAFTPPTNGEATANDATIDDT
jgi:hypothetical protein